MALIQDTACRTLRREDVFRFRHKWLTLPDHSLHPMSPSRQSPTCCIKAPCRPGISASGANLLYGRFPYEKSFKPQKPQKSIQKPPTEGTKIHPSFMTNEKYSLSKAASSLISTKLNCSSRDLLTQHLTWGMSLQPTVATLELHIVLGLKSQHPQIFVS